MSSNEKDRKRKWRLGHLDLMRLYQKKYRLAHPNVQKDWRARNKDKLKEQGKILRQTERFKLYRKQYRKDHPEITKSIVIHYLQFILNTGILLRKGNLNSV